ncbi:MAG: hypothetical protein KDA96_03605 [Planctomycetaceae bacterium]|nr:hypothetical protein [Planctomycetaceae bacterium]
MALFGRGNDPLSNLFGAALHRMLQSRAACLVLLALFCGIGTVFTWNTVVDWQIMSEGATMTLPVVDEVPIRSNRHTHYRSTFHYPFINHADTKRLFPELFSNRTSEGLATTTSSIPLRSCRTPNPTITVRYLKDSPGTWVVEGDYNHNFLGPMFSVIGIGCSIGLSWNIMRLDATAKPVAPASAHNAWQAL